jgi:predicted short-subunit dehydrogenase-like oxidoreductase (DUF2520 family)
VDDAVEVTCKDGDMAGTCVIVGSGRAGGSFHRALSEVGWTCELVPGRSVSPGMGEVDVDLILLTVPDTAIASVARSIAPTDAVVAHVSGACGLEILAPHERVGSIHPLMSLPDSATGSRRLLDRCTFAIEGDPLMADLAADLGGRSIEVSGPQRALYHATAAIAANHLTALCAQVKSLAAEVGVPVDAYWTLMSTTLENIADVGPAAALTGPAARGDWNTIRTHLDALPTDDDRRLYLALCEHAARLGGHELDSREFA